MGVRAAAALRRLQIRRDPPLSQLGENGPLTDQPPARLGDLHEEVLAAAGQNKLMQQKFQVRSLHGALAIILSGDDHPAGDVFVSAAIEAYYGPRPYGAAVPTRSSHGK